MLESGQIEARRAILIGDIDHCLAVSVRLQSAGIRIVRSFAMPAEVFKCSHELKAVLQRLVENCRGLDVEDVFLLAESQSLSTVAASAQKLAELPVNVQVLPVETLDAVSTAKVVRCGDMMALRLFDRRLTSLDRVVKRSFDVFAAAIGLVVLLPVFALVAIAIKLESPGPVLFSQRRHGYNNIPIRMYKFRTMMVMEDGDEFRQATKHDPRVTGVGHILRRTSIDELPQLYNVLTGEMSIVGPRPHAIAHNKMFNRKIEAFWRRHNVKPGITGWAQVNGCRGETNTLNKMRRRIEYDLEYVDRWSLVFDLKIILMTIFSKNAHLHAY
jgi:Undecaprenyl-phosphate glucose phosphotransferase